jgi:hypothetical protein
MKENNPITLRGFNQLCNTANKIKGILKKDTIVLSPQKLTLLLREEDCKVDVVTINQMIDMGIIIYSEQGLKIGTDPFKVGLLRELQKRVFEYRISHNKSYKQRYGGRPLADKVKEVSKIIRTAPIVTEEPKLPFPEEKVWLGPKVNAVKLSTEPSIQIHLFDGKVKITSETLNITLVGTVQITGNFRIGTV